MSAVAPQRTLTDATAQDARSQAEPMMDGGMKGGPMPAVSKAQQRFMGAELGRKSAGKRTRTGMTEEQLRDFAATNRKGLPARKKQMQGKHQHNQRLREIRGKDAGANYYA